VRFDELPHDGEPKSHAAFIVCPYCAPVPRKIVTAEGHPPVGRRRQRRDTRHRDDDKKNNRSTEKMFHV
jgi:hypothetical protein